MTTIPPNLRPEQSSYAREQGVNEVVSFTVNDAMSANVNEVVSDYIPTTWTSATIKRYSPLAGAVLYAAELCGFEPPAWAVAAPGLAEEQVYSGDEFESKEFKDFIRRSTPAVFLERKILTRPRDWETARDGFGRA